MATQEAKLWRARAAWGKKKLCLKFGEILAEILGEILARPIFGHLQKSGAKKTHKRKRIWPKKAKNEVMNRNIKRKIH